ncbi:MAG: EAL domain-containing protein, partial [Spirochaetaceae bacterium]
YYPDLTIQMLLQACDAFAKASCLCTLNYSIVDIENERVVQKTMDILKENPGFASRLVIELVEQEDGSDFELVADFMRDVRQLGAQVAIDDFGSGYSNLRRLMELDFNYVKIDGSLVRDITVSQRAKQLTDWVVGFAEQAKVKLIAEFVETEEHRRLLLDAGVDLGQGYLFGRPEPLRVIKQKLYAVFFGC